MWVVGGGGCSNDCSDRSTSSTVSIFFLFYRKHVNFLLGSLKWMTTIDKCIFPIDAAIKLSEQSVINSFVT